MPRCITQNVRMIVNDEMERTVRESNCGILQETTGLVIIMEYAPHSDNDSS